LNAGFEGGIGKYLDEIPRAARSFPFFARRAVRVFVRDQKTAHLLDAKPAGELRREVVVYTRGMTAAGEKQKRFARSCPIQIMQLHAADGDEPLTVR
jgi:hypothetical protein